MSDQLTCYLCYRESTPYIVSYGGNVSGPCLPVCIYCIRPWINDAADDWWFERRLPGSVSGNQRKPTQQEVEAAVSMRLIRQQQDAVISTAPVDQAIRERAERSDYRTKFHIDELLKRQALEDMDRQASPPALSELAWRDISEIVPGKLYQTCAATAERTSELMKRGISKVICVTTLDERTSPLVRAEYVSHGIDFAHVELEDIRGASLIPACEQVAHHINTTAGACVIHCAQGISRSSAVLLFLLLLEHGDWSVADALAHLVKHRPSAKPNAGFLAQLKAWRAHTHA